MSLDQMLVFAVLGAALLLFAWERWRYDLVAVASLVAVVVLGLVPVDRAFAGFGHVATVSVAAILVMSRGLANSGAVDLLARPIAAATRSQGLHVGTVCGIAALLSGFMNNVAALALLMPVTIQSAARAKRSPALLLMPLAFAAVLGGIVTMIGTPPNLILSGFRAQALGEPYRLLDFAPVGLPVAVAGVLFLVLVGWRLLRVGAAPSGADRLALVRDYLAELQVAEESPVAGLYLGELDERLEDIDAVILGVIRDEHLLPPDGRWLRLKAGDLLLVEAEPGELDRLSAKLGTRLAGVDEDEDRAGRLAEDTVMEVVVRPQSRLVGRTVGSLRLPGRFDINLLAVSRQGRPYRGRLRHFAIRSGDVLLLQGDPQRLADIVSRLGGLPLAERKINMGLRGRAGLGLLLFFVPLALGALQVVPLAIALVASALLMVLGGLIPVRDLYDSIDWPVVVLLGAMMPLGDAFQATGATDLVAGTVLAFTGEAPLFVLVALLIFVTMLLSDLLNNAATAVMMGPIALAIAGALNASPDTFLMAVAIGASCSFLTPVGHQNYTLVMGPGGYRFRDYWRLGLPLELLIVAVATPLIVYFWPA
ncbi:SLC13 family permease [Geminicoccaceae bacterium 1502E]|nr:SLC13 family permease [Geminicoccaceae bacterium 1502E]